MWPRVTPTASRKPASVAAQSVTVKVSGGSDERPAPGASHATNLNWPARSLNCWRQHRKSQRNPCRSTKGGPLPTVR